MAILQSIEAVFTARGISWHDDTLSGQVIFVLSNRLCGPDEQRHSIKRADITSFKTFFTELDRKLFGLVGI